MPALLGRGAAPLSGHGKRARGGGKTAVILALALALAAPVQLTFVGASARAPPRLSVGRAAGTEVTEKQTEQAETEEVTDKQTEQTETEDQKRLREWEEKQVVDEGKLLAASAFPIAPDELIKKAKVFLSYDNGLNKPDLLAEGFEFAGPVVGPLSKDQFLNSLRSFSFVDAFPDANAEWHHFRVDPFEPSRVWFTARGRGTNSGEVPKSPLFKKPTGKSYVNPPQACSVRFDSDGKVNQYTIGYVMDRRIGNTGGLGGIYGIAWAVGKGLPFPEAQPWKRSLRYTLFDKLANFLQNLQKKKEG